MAGCCESTGTRDWTALFKSMFVVILCGVMLLCYGSAYISCERMHWDEIDYAEVDIHEVKASECRFAFYDRTFRVTGPSVHEGHAYVVYYIFFWTCTLITAVLSTLALCCYCCVFLRRFLALVYFVLTVLLVIADVVSIGITFGHYVDFEDIVPSEDDKDRVKAFRNHYIGLNCAILVMQTYILLSTAYDLADTRDMKEESDDEMPEQEMATQKHGVLA